MAHYDFTSHRLFLDADLAAGAAVAVSAEQANYLLAVLRLKAGTRLLVFNGRDGEWAAEIAEAGKRRATLRLLEQTRPQARGPDLHYLFAPLKHARLDYMVQKATEMGVACLQPVMTRRTVAERVNLERMRANAIEAAEQCGVLRLPDVRAPVKLDGLLASWDATRRLVFCDEDAPVQSPLAALAGVSAGPLALLIGPEGGFSEEERTALLRLPAVTRLSLGPRILRADTAAVAALALVNAAHGDWR